MDDTHPFFSRWYNLDIGSNILSKILIHTPSKGVTNYISIHYGYFLFQSTLPRREWHCMFGDTGSSWHISIHTPTKGVTPLIISPIASKDISIHTPTKGVTLFRHCYLIYWKFQSTLPRREWLWSARARCLLNNFNPHSHEGSDDGAVIFPFLFQWFQSTLPRREWRRDKRKLHKHSNFNPHSHEGSDLSYTVSVK